MSKVFSSKRSYVEFDYEFLDGTKVSFKVYEPTTKMIDEVTKNVHDPVKSLDLSKKQVKELVKHDNDSSLVTKMVKELTDEGNIYDFSKAIGELITEEKKKKAKN